MKHLLYLITGLLAFTLARGQTACENLAADRGLQVTDTPVCLVDARPVSYPDFLRILEKDHSRHRFAIRLMLYNNSDTVLPLTLGFDKVDYVDLRIGNRIEKGGDLQYLSPAWTYLERQASVLPFSLAAREHQQLQVEIRQLTDDFSFGGLTIYDDNSLNSQYIGGLRNSNNEYIFRMLFLGFLVCQFLYMLFQWVMVRRREYLYYLLYSSLIIIYFLSRMEILFGVPILFTRWPLLTIYLGKTLLILPYFFYFRFIRSFLDMPVNYPRLNTWMVRLENFLLIYSACDLVFIFLTFDRQLQTLFYTIIFSLVFVLTIFFMVYVYRRGGTLAYYIVSGSLFVGTGHILGLIFSYFEINLHKDLGVPDIFVFPQAGIVLEVLCFTAGLSYKALMTEKDKILSQQKLIEQLKANELLQHRMQHIRNKIAQDLHDDIGSTLSSISILSDLALRDKGSAQTMETMTEIKDNSMLLMERMDDIVWSISPRNDSLENLLMRVRHFATTLFEARGIDYSIDIQKNVNEVRLPMDYRQHIYLILKEAINNLVKYSRAGRAALEVRFDSRHLTLSVRDDGRGFDPISPSAGNGITGMQRRAQLMNADLSITSSPGQGTQIRLQVAVA